MEADQEGVLESIRHERKFQDKKWGVQDHPDGYWLAILMEEVGEVASALMDHKENGHPDCLVNKELIQVAAVAVAWMEARARQGVGAAAWEPEHPGWKPSPAQGKGE